MKKIVFFMCFLVLAAAASSTFAADNAFKYDANKMDVGNVYHYVRSTIDDKNVVDNYWYIKSGDAIETYASNYPFAPAVVWSEQSFDFNNFMIKKSVTKNLMSEYKLPNMLIGTECVWDIKKMQEFFTRKVTDDKVQIKSVSFITPFKSVPCIEYNTNSVNIAIIYRFLKPDVKSFQIGWTANGQYSEATVTLEKEETVNGILCRKYKMEAAGLLAKIFHAKLEIWLAKDDPRQYMVKYIGYMKSDAYYPNQKIELKEITKTTDAEWQTQINNEVANFKKLMNLK